MEHRQENKTKRSSLFAGNVSDEIEDYITLTTGAKIKHIVLFVSYFHIRQTKKQGFSAGLIFKG